MFRFTKDCIIGVDQLDKEHQYLFELINDGIDILHNNYIGERYEDMKQVKSSRLMFVKILKKYWRSLKIIQRNILHMRKPIWKKYAIRN